MENSEKYQISMEKTIYVSTRKELSEQLINQRAIGATCYRIRTACLCWQPRDINMHMRANQRNGVIAILDNYIVAKYVRCKFCSKGAALPASSG